MYTVHAYLVLWNFTLHAIIIHPHSQRNGQRVSYTAWAILAALWLTMLISLFVSVGGKLHWLDLLYIVSYVKLAVTLLKYIPQVIKGHMHIYSREVTRR